MSSEETNIETPGGAAGALMGAEIEESHAALIQMFISMLVSLLDPQLTN